MQRGEVRLVDFSPAAGAEVDGVRPAVIVSHDGANATAARLGYGVVTVIPLTTSLAKVYRFQVVLPARDCGLRRDSKAQAEQIRAVAVQRVGDRMGRVPRRLLDRIDDALRLHLML